MPNRVLDATFGVKNFFEALGKTSPIDIGIGTEANIATPAKELVGSQISKPNSKYMFHLEASRPTFNTPAGSQVKAYSSDFPILKGNKMSVLAAILHVGGIREPHWHP